MCEMSGCSVDLEIPRIGLDRPLYRTSGKPWEVWRMLEMACHNAGLSSHEISILERG